MKWLKILIILFTSAFSLAGELENKRLINSKVQTVTNKLISDAQSKDPEAMYQLALAYIHNGSSDSLELLLEAAEQGHEKAMYVYAHLNKNNVPVAVAWLEKAKKNGYAPAFYYLGFFYLRGGWSGWTDYTDYKKAYDNLIEAIYRGSIYSQALLAEMYFEGLGVKKDTEKARILYLDSAQKGVYSSYGTLALKWYDRGGLTPDSDKFSEYWYIYKNNKDRVWCGEDEQGRDYVCDESSRSPLHEIFYYLAEYM